MCIEGDVMNQIDWGSWHYLAVQLGIKVVGALVFWVVGRWLIDLGNGLLGRQLRHRGIDSTLIHYVHSFVSVSLTILLVIGILGFLGVETTTFAAVLAAAGVAVGLAWSGLLANFAAGLFLIVLRPFKVGDLITAAGTTGTVTEIGLFATTIDTPDNIRTLVGNNKLFSDNIQNYSINPYRRVDLKAQLAAGADHAQAIALLRDKLAAVPNVLAEPKPDVALLEFTALGPVLAVRPYCKPDDYWQVYFDSNLAIREELGRAGFPVPEQAVALRQL